MKGKKRSFKKRKTSQTHLESQQPCKQSLDFWRTIFFIEHQTLKTSQVEQKKLFPLQQHKYFACFTFPFKIFPLKKMKYFFSSSIFLNNPKFSEKKKKSMGWGFSLSSFFRNPIPYLSERNTVFHQIIKFICTLVTVWYCNIQHLLVLMKKVQSPTGKRN